jgi:hypothetical protein
MVSKTASALIATIALVSFNTHASLVTHNVIAEVTSGPFSGQTGSVSFSYDDSLLRNFDLESL